jgi:hypothetical protein
VLVIGRLADQSGFSRSFEATASLGGGVFTLPIALSVGAVGRLLTIAGLVEVVVGGVIFRGIT